MAVVYTTITARGVDGSGNRRRSVVDIAYTGESYSSGVPVVIASLGAPTLLEELSIMDDSSDADLVKYDHVNEKLRVYLSGSGTEVAGSLTRTVRVIAEGY